MNATRVFFMSLVCTFAIAACDNEGAFENGGNPSGDAGNTDTTGDSGNTGDSDNTGNGGNTDAQEPMSAELQKACEENLSKEAACGGEDVKGTWKLGGICESPEELAKIFAAQYDVAVMTLSACPEEPAAEISISPENATLEVTDSVFKQSGKLVLNVPFAMSNTCLTKNTGDELTPAEMCDHWEKSYEDYSKVLKGMSGSCTYANDYCECLLKFDVPLDVDGTYTASGDNGLNVTASSVEGEVLYCTKSDVMAAQTGLGVEALAGKILKGAWERVK